MSLSDYEILGFNLGGLLMTLPLLVLLIVIFWRISCAKQENLSNNNEG